MTPEELNAAKLELDKRDEGWRRRERRSVQAASHHATSRVP